MAVINRMVIGSGFVKLAPLSVQGILTKANKLVNGLLMMQRGKGL
jgi:hypothetical protein